MQAAYVTTSWDDGYPQDLRVAELLDKHGLTGTFYVPKTAERGVIDDADVRRLDDAFEVGAHTVHHTVLTTVSDDTARTEIEESKAWLEDVTGHRCPLFCFPQGKFRDAHLRMVQAAGFRAARTVELMSVARPRDLGSLLLMPTTVQAVPHSGWTYLANGVKRRRWDNLVRLFRAGWTRGWVEQTERLLAHVAETGGVFHLWGHSWEIEEHDLWDDLDRALALLGKYVGDVKYAGDVTSVTNGELCATVSHTSGAQGVAERDGSTR